MDLLEELKQITQNLDKAEWEGRPLKVLSPQGLILLKSLRNSGQDKDDIEYLRSMEHED